MDNQTIARWLTDYAHYLETRPESLYRIRAYRRAAQTMLGLSRPVSAILSAEGRAGLARLPGIGSHLAFTIDELVRTGEFRTWEERHQPRDIDACSRASHAEREPALSS
ncbi:MAG TPA: helix-hairpin-helix domain-containing protein [Gemmataceae bacterium]|nr:helix-hairpin-helix domain-containing protein [Gemmataceae bacterium]